jgi:hypothetical protein
MMKHEPRQPPSDEARALAVAQRHAEIAKLMEQVRLKRLKLLNKIELDQVDEADALKRNESMPGILGELWAQFLALPKSEKLVHLGRDDFCGMHWQSLLQCSPYIGSS